MATITVYSFESKDGTEDTFTTVDVHEARERARRYRMKLIANEYEWTDSEVIEDFTASTERYSPNTVPVAQPPRAKKRKSR